MDPKLSNLDPKLQDAYNRVMGGSNPNPAPNNSSQPSTDQQSENSASQVPPPADPAPGITPPSQFGDASSQNPSNTAMPPTTESPSMPQSQSSPPMPDNNTPSNDFSPPTNPQPAPSIDYGTGNQPEPSPAASQPSHSVSSQGSTVAFNATNSSKNIGTTPVKRGGLHILPIIVSLGILLLLVVYTFVWIIIFNVQVPYLPQLF